MNSKPEIFKSNGKLLITGEYVVLDGAVSLAVPTAFGQSMKVEQISEPKIIWKSLNKKGNAWFENEFLIDAILSNSSKFENKISNQLVHILQEAKYLNPEFLTQELGYKITTKLDFPKNWGLGTSSTLINNIANWAKVDAYQLLEKTFGGSGYDIACAQQNSPISYQLISNKPNFKKVNFNPPFKENLYFIYLNKKQDSREGIAHYKSNKTTILKEILAINDITHKVIDCENLENFRLLIDEHERIISKIIRQQPVKELLFSDFRGSIKSLGAWGGDFVMAASEENPSTYFKSKGFDTVLSYKDLIK